MNELILRAEAVTKVIPQLGPLLNSVDLQIRCGESVALVGPSGSGKSTLLQIIGGLLKADSGTVSIEGITPQSRKDWRRIHTKSMGFVFQDAWLIPALTAAENIELPMLGVRPACERRVRVRHLLQALGLDARKNSLASVLSGGERQRVAVARAMANEPRLLLADEPTGSLDWTNRGAVIEQLFTVARQNNASVLLATHDPELAKLCDRTVRLQAGCLTELSRWFL